MRRLASVLSLPVLAAILFGATAPAAVASSVGATDIQGVSARLVGSVNPGGLPTTFSFQYVDDAAYAAGGFGSALLTPTEPAGSGTSPRPVSASVSGLSPSTLYHVRLLAQNSSGATVAGEGTFTTTAGFGVLPGSEGFSVSVPKEGGDAATAAGSHPYQLTFQLRFREGGEFEGQPGASFPDGDLRHLQVEMPHGMIENPSALPKCSPLEFHTPRSSPFEASESGESCPESTQVGVAEVQTSLNGGERRRFGLFNLEPPPGVPSQIGFSPFGEPIVFDSLVRRGVEGTYAITLDADNVPQGLAIDGLSLTLWGTPWGAGHNGERGNCLNEAEPAFPWAKCPAGVSPSSTSPLAYLTLPTTCEGALTFVARATSWQQPGEVAATAVNRTFSGEPAAATGCDGLIFDPHPVGRLLSKKASSPTGFNFQLVNNNEALTLPGFRVQSQARRVVVELPEGVTINPSVGAGLGVCTPAQYEAETAGSQEGQGCPNSSKIGDFSVETPLFDDRIKGALYLAEPDDPASTAAGAENPFDSLLAIYLVGRSSARGVLIRLAGRLDPDPASGRLIATFDSLPELPYTNLEINFREGQRAPLVSPPSCGTHFTKIAMTPWVGTAQTAHATSESHVEAGIEGTSCPSGTPPFRPGAVAGGVNSNVGSYTPYYIHLTRKDDEQEITSYSLILPKGITGKLAGVPFCPEAAIAAARDRSGLAETSDPSCPGASQIGRTFTGYGVGSALTYAPGKLYLAGPYNGAPLSVVAVNAATVGPFDLGTIVIRSAFNVDPHTAQLSIDSRASDPIPHILDGIPLHLRDIRIYVDRHEFTLNPTSCEPSRLTSTLTGSGARFDDPGDDSTATVGVHFQLLNCGTLGYSPKLGLKLRGGIRRGAYPSLQAVVQGRPGDANLKDFAVTMPHSMFLAQNHIRGVCTRVQFDADACPANSVYGSATAITPLFDEPLRGEVYLRSSSRRLPDLVASLRSGAIHIVLEGHIGPADKGIRTEFSGLPDAPLTRFVMKLNGGKRGLLVNSANICVSPPLATARAIGQNNRGAAFSAQLRSDRCRKHRKKHRARHVKHSGKERR